MKIMYAIRLTLKGKSTVIRLSTEKDARDWVNSTNERNDGISAKYIGKVKISYARLDILNADPKKKSHKKRSK